MDTRARITVLEVNADDPDRALRFYAGVFGWTAERIAGEVEYYEGGTSDAGIRWGVKRGVAGPTRATYLPTIEGGDVELQRELIPHYGGQIIRGPTRIHEVGWWTYCRDSEGHVFGLLKRDGDGSIP